jgi:2-keto-4-pentenoate hydratase/2-oxohepta-3-ene-1,7-dioic acid hydratase in catechol pathway
MKIVGFESGNEPRLGPIEGDQVVDLNAVDGRLSHDLGTALRGSDGNLAPLADLARRAPASARRPLRGLTYGLPIARPGKVVCLGLNYLEHVKEGPTAIIFRNFRPSSCAA